MSRDTSLDSKSDSTLGSSSYFTEKVTYLENLKLTVRIVQQSNLNINKNLASSGVGKTLGTLATC